MLGWIMPEPLAMPVTVTVLPPIRTCRDAPLATMSVVMMACAASLQWPGARSACAAGRAAQDLVDRQRLQNHPGGKRQHLLRRNAEQLRNGRAGLPGAGEAFRAGARVGVAGVDDERADAAACQMLLAHGDRRGAEAVLREHARHVRAGREFDQGDVAAAGLFDAGRRNAEADAGNRQQGGGIGGDEIDGHGGGDPKGTGSRYFMPGCAASCGPAIRRET